MRYFLLDAGDETIANTITNAEMEPLSRYGKARYWEVQKRIVHVPYLDTGPDITSATELPDAIGVGVELIVSERLSECLKSFCVDDGVSFLPVEIVNRGQVLLSSSYLLLMSRTWLNVLDATASKAVLFNDGAIDAVENWVLSRSALPSLDWWYAHEHSWIANEKVCSRIKEFGFTNVRTTQVGVR